MNCLVFISTYVPQLAGFSERSVEAGAGRMMAEDKLGMFFFLFQFN
jgi:hypothetical protein